MQTLRPLILAALLTCLSACCAARVPEPDTELLTTPMTPDGGVIARGFDEATWTVLRTLAPNDARWREVLTVHVDGGAETSSAPAMLGTYAIEGDAVRFIPRFPLQRGLAYRATVNRDAFSPGMPARPPLTKTFEIAKEDDAPLTHVGAIYPTGTQLPENLLKFYIEFTAPMSKGDSYRHIQLLDEAGKPVDLPFLELPQELWNREGTRLTLLLDPGRVKQGLKPRDDEGPILVSGKRYTLVIDRAWLDARGRPLEKSVRKTFTATDADVTQPDPATWKWTVPAANTTELVVIRFPEALDRALLEDSLSVRDADGKLVPSAIVIADREMSCSIVAADRWKAGRYTLVIATTLEDLAGNSVGRAFEVDLKKTPNAKAAPAAVTIDFDVK